MKHERSSVPAVSEAAPTPPLNQWQVFSADRHLVATYSTEAAAAAHVACWPALFYFAVPLSPPAPLSTSSVPS